MKNLTKAAILGAAVALVCQGAYAATDDLILGFTGNSASTDTTFNLGSLSTSTVSAGTLGNVSGFASVGVFGATAQNGNTPGTGIDLSVARAGLNPSSSQGTEAAPTGPASATTLASANPDVKAIIIGSGVASFSANSYSANTVPPNPPAQNDSVFSDDGLNSSLVANGASVSLDIFKMVEGTGVGRGAVPTIVTYVGELILSNVGGVESYVFDPNGVSTAVPEPAAYGAIAGAGLLALSLRRQFRRSNA